MKNVDTTKVVIAHEPAAEQAAAQSRFGMRHVYLLAGLCLVGVVFGWLQFSTRAICCGDFDGYYHIKWSQTLWQGLRAHHFPPQFIWLPLTTLNARAYVEHHLL